MAKKIVLVNMPDDKCVRDWRMPESSRGVTTPSYVPLGLLSLATNLKPNQEAIIIDARSKGLSIDETIERIEQERPDILGLHSNVMRAYALKEILQRTSVPYKAVGGLHASRYPQIVLSQGADAVFAGTLADLEFREAVDSQPKGIINCKTTYADIKFPNRSLIDYESYFPKNFVFFKTENRLHMLTTIGCPHNCFYCDNIPGKLQRKSAEAVLDEMQHLYSLGSRSIHLLDDNFNVSENYLHGVLDEMDKREFQVEWSGRGQLRMSDNLAKRMSDHGFKRIHVGIEAIDDEILRYYKKDSSVKRIYEFCESMNNNHIDVFGLFIVGAPVEKEEYLERFPGMLKELGIKYPHIQILSPTPDSEYYKELLDQGIYKTDIWAEHIKNPTPDFQIPYPYSQERLKMLSEYVDNIEKEYVLNG
jgi:anaerobic magnesium-protoporphyrin IX monomethyl ester cyclase